MIDLIENIALLFALLASGAAMIVVIIVMLVKFDDFLENYHD